MKNNPTTFTDSQFQDPNFLLEQMEIYDQAHVNKTEFPFTSQIRDIIEIQYDHLTMDPEELRETYPNSF